jgi:hypothetical protein
MAVWYVADRMVEGPVFGSRDTWKGLGIIFDTFDNDGRVRNEGILALRFVSHFFVSARRACHPCFSK